MRKDEFAKSSGKKRPKKTSGFPESPLHLRRSGGAEAKRGGWSFTKASK
jgi:hypothetical protein